MEIHLLSFASRCFYKSQENLVRSAGAHGIKKIHAWKYYQLIPSFFFWKNLKILRSKRGAGYWAWQPHILLDTMRKIDSGDVVVFCDAGLEIIHELSFVKEIMQNNDVVFFSAGDFINEKYTRRDTFVLMGCDEEVYKKSPQVMGGIHIWKKTDRAMALLHEYLIYCSSYQVIADTPNKFGENAAGFIDHRHPQSILSLLALKHKLLILPVPFGSQEHVTGEHTRYVSKINFPKFLKFHRERVFTLVDRILYKTGLWI